MSVYRGHLSDIYKTMHAPVPSDPESPVLPTYPARYMHRNAHYRDVLHIQPYWHTKGSHHDTLYPMDVVHPLNKGNRSKHSSVVAGLHKRPQVFRPP